MGTVTNKSLCGVLVLSIACAIVAVPAHAGHTELRTELPEPYIHADQHLSLLDPQLEAENASPARFGIERRNIVSLIYGRQDRTDVHGNDWTLEVSYTIEFLNPSAPPETGTLEIKHTPGEQIYEQAKVHTSAAGEVMVTINSATRSGPTTVPSDISIELILQKERYEWFDTDIQKGGDLFTVVLPPMVAWETLPGAEEYDLEWVWIDEEEPSLGSADPFEYKSPSRVTITDNYYQRDFEYPGGTLYFRVRGVGRFISDGDDYTHRRVGAWHKLMAPGTPASAVTAGGENGKNWQLITSFSEHGKHKKVMSYFDGTLRSRQMLTNLSSSSTAFTGSPTVLIGETKYDHEGRGAVTILPVPAIRSSEPPLGYLPSFNVDVGGSVFSRDDFDLGVSNPLGTTSGAGRYYSSANDVDGPHRDYIPDASGYAYSQIEYTRDNTGRMRRSGNVGETFVLGNGHETKYFYSDANATELHRMFGSNVGVASHYKKNFAVDPNGQVSVSYLDQEGRVIATALAGDVPANLDSLAVPPSTPLTFDLRGDNHMDAEAGVSTTISRIPNVSPNTVYQFDYDLTGVIYENTAGGGTPTCAECVYELSIQMFDPSGFVVKINDPDSGQVDVLRRIIPDSILDPCTPGTTGVTLTFIDTLTQIGEYTVVKTLSLGRSNVESLIGEAIDNAGLGSAYLAALMDSFRQEVDTTTCDIVCEDHARSYYASIGNPNPTQQQIDTWVEENCGAVVDSAIADLAGSECQALYLQMLEEMGPDSVTYHREYCHFVACTLLVSSGSTEYDAQMARIETFAEARDSVNNFGNYNFEHPVPLIGVNCATTRPTGDPIFNSHLPQSSLRCMMIESLRCFYFDAPNWHSVREFVEYAWVYGHTPTEEEKWDLFRSIYLGVKRSVLQTYWDCDYYRDSDAIVRDPYEIDVADTLQALEFIEDHYSQYCADICNGNIDAWMRVVEDSCPALTPAELEDARGHLLDYCYNNCSPANPLGWILAELVVVDPDLVALDALLESNGCDLDVLTIVKVNPYTYVPGSGGCDSVTVHVINPCFLDLIDLLNQYVFPCDGVCDISVDPDDSTAVVTDFGVNCGEMLGITNVVIEPYQISLESPSGPVCPKFEIWGQPDAWVGIRADYILELFDVRYTDEAPWGVPGYGYVGVEAKALVNYPFWPPDSIITVYFFAENPSGGSGKDAVDFFAENPSGGSGKDAVAYLAAGRGGLQIVDVSNPANPIVRGALGTPGTASGVAVAGEYAYVAGGVRGGLVVVDVSDAGRPELVGRSDIPTQARSVVVTGNHAYVADGLDGLRIFDVRDPRRLRLAATYDTPGDARDVAISGHHAYIADGRSGLQILNISESSRPVLVGTYDTAGMANGVVVYGNDAYVADGRAGLHIVDVSDPSRPIFKGRLDTPGDASDVALAGDYAYVADGRGGLRVIGIGRPSDPTPTGSYPHRFADRVTILGPHAYVASRYSGLQVIDIRDPKSPVAKGGLVTTGGAQDIEVRGEIVAMDEPPPCFPYYTRTKTTCIADSVAASVDSLYTFHLDLAAVRDTCLALLYAQADYSAEKTYEETLRAFRNEFYKKHYAECFAGPFTESFTYTYTPKEYCYTLYYYDQAGNVVQTVPPEGVDLIDRQGALDSLVQGLPGAPEPDHTYKTVYKYNSLDQLASRRTPDAGDAVFFYDDKGQLRFSQNAKQSASGDYSYTKYDEQGRIIEVGEAALGGDPSTTNLNDPSFPGNPAILSEVTETHYDDAVYTVPNLTQENLRGRIASMSIQEQGAGSIDHATHYTYDELGNVASLVNQNPSLQSFNAEYHRVDYVYDKIGENVNEVHYQTGHVDQFHHRYEYDADNRLTDVYTSSDSVLWERDAKYLYYRQGPLARIELGQDKVQGVDYAYTLQGWVKGVNSNTLSPQRDMGGDGLAGGGYVARDAFGFTLGYYENSASALPRDYEAVGVPFGNTHFEATVAGSGFGSGTFDLFNSNIRHMATSILKPDGSSLTPQGTAYRYDQLNRLVSMDAYQTLDSLTNQWGAGSSTGDYNTDYAYDLNGNFTSLNRNAFGTGDIGMDRLVYSYNNGHNNQLTSVVDNSTSPLDGTLNDLVGTTNYTYDAIGNLESDDNSEIQDIDWTNLGTIKRIIRTPTSTEPEIEFRYGASGKRETKIVKPAGGNQQDWEYTYYVRGARGNVLAAYEQSGSSLALVGATIQGYCRVGVAEISVDLAAPPLSGGVATRTRGAKQYELMSHLGSVLATVSDYRRGKDTTGMDGIVEYYEPDPVGYADYYPFGWQMPGRHSMQQQYRYEFGGKEGDSEIYGSNGTAYDYGFRLLNSRLGRFLAPDFVSANYPSESPYVFSGNDVVRNADIGGFQKINVAIDNTVHYGPVNMKIVNAQKIKENPSLATDIAMIKMAEIKETMLNYVLEYERYGDEPVESTEPADQFQLQFPIQEWPTDATTVSDVTLTQKDAATRAVSLFLLSMPKSEEKSALTWGDVIDLGMIGMPKVGPFYDVLDLVSSKSLEDAVWKGTKIAVGVGVTIRYGTPAGRVASAVMWWVGSVAKHPETQRIIEENRLEREEERGVFHLYSGEAVLKPAD